MGAATQPTQDPTASVGAEQDSAGGQDDADVADLQDDMGDLAIGNAAAIETPPGLEPNASAVNNQAPPRAP